MSTIRTQTLTTLLAETPTSEVAMDPPPAPYVCSTCGATCVVVSQMTEQVVYHPFADPGGRIHTHDRNRGVVTLRCTGPTPHTEVQPYVTVCPCGWTSREPKKVVFTEAPFDYTCTHCGAACDALETHTTEAYAMPFMDAEGHVHHHDTANTGVVRVRCKGPAAHEYEEAYVAACTCGWNSAAGGGRCPFPHRVMDDDY
jgi:hypothetical protein